MQMWCTSTPSLTLLHLSDLHFGQDPKLPTSTFNQRLVTEKLLEDIKAQVNKGLKPDAILITGDIAYSAQADQYKDAQGWIQKILFVTSLPPEQVFVVPGNHDVDRAWVKNDLNAKTLHERLKSDPSQINHYLPPSTLPELSTQIIPKLNQYNQFATGYGKRECTAARPFWRHDWTNPYGKPVVVLGLNTCLLSCEGDNKENLALGLGQLESAFKDLPKEALVLVLAHHPPEWLVDGEAGPSTTVAREHALTTFLQGYPHVLFVGHVHVQGGHAVTPLNTGGLLRFVAGAGHESVSDGGKHAYAWVQLLPDGIRYYPRMWNPDRQRFQPEGFTFELVSGQEYAFFKRGKLSDALSSWLKLGIWQQFRRCIGLGLGLLLLLLAAWLLLRVPPPEPVPLSLIWLPDTQNDQVNAQPQNEPALIREHLKRVGMKLLDQGVSGLILEMKFRSSDQAGTEHVVELLTAAHQKNPRVQVMSVVSNDPLFPECSAAQKSDACFDGFLSGDTQAGRASTDPLTQLDACVGGRRTVAAQVARWLTQLMHKRPLESTTHCSEQEYVTPSEKPSRLLKQACVKEVESARILEGRLAEGVAILALVGPGDSHEITYGPGQTVTEEGTRIRAAGAVWFHEKWKGAP